MPNRSINQQTKVKIVLSHLSGAKVVDIAREYEVSRDSIYRWKDRALRGLSQALKRYPKRPSSNKRRA